MCTYRGLVNGLVVFFYADTLDYEKKYECYLISNQELRLIHLPKIKEIRQL